MAQPSLDLLSELLDEEIKSIELRKIPKSIYMDVASYIRRMNHREDSVVGKLRDREKELMGILATRLLRLRVEKASEGGVDEALLTPEERYVLETSTLRGQRLDRIMDAIVRGHTAVLSSINASSTSRYTLVRVLKPLSAVVGVDLKRYGPFKPEDVALIPAENAKLMVKQGSAVELWIEQPI